MRLRVPLILAFLAAAGAWAQEGADLPEVVVTATRLESSVVESPGFITVVTSKEIAESGARDFAEALAAQSGVEVKDNGPLGSVKTLSIRGSSAEQVLVLVDGVRLNSSRTGYVDLSTIPLEMIDRIEVVRGGESSLYGTGANGGVINIITRKGGAPSLSLSVTNGSFIPHDATAAASGAAAPSDPMDLVDGQKAELSLTGSLGQVGMTAGGAFSRAANGYTWDTGSGAWKRRDHASNLSGNGYTAVTAPLLGGELSARGIFSAAKTDVPGRQDIPTPTAVQQTTAASGALAYDTDRFLVDALDLSLKGVYRWDSLSYVDPTWSTNDLHSTTSAALDLTQRFTFSSFASAVYGGSASYEHTQSTAFAAPKDRTNLAGFLSLPVTFLSALTVTPSVRYDWYSDFAAALSYQLAVVALLSDAASVKASVGSAYRVPALNDLYWYDPLGFTSGNPALQPETSYNAEVGLSVAGAALSVDASVFGRLGFNDIVWTLDSMFVYTPMNLYRTFTPGAELSARLSLFERITLTAAYTLLYSFLLNDGTGEIPLSADRRVPYSPLNSASVEARYADGVSSAGVNVQYVGQKFTDAANTPAKALAQYFVLGADYRLTPMKGLTFSVTGRNLLNAVYQTQYMYPMPPLSLETGVHVKL
jgi:vitamin B12 transporter